MVKKNVLQSVLGILGTAPDEAIKNVIWIEIFKLQLALKGLASAIDSLRAKAATISAGQPVTYNSLGNVEYALYLQDLTTVRVLAGATIPANTSVNFYSSGGSIAAYPNPVAEGAQGYSTNRVSAGSEGNFILKGFIGYTHIGIDSMSGGGSSNNQLTSQPGNSHYRISTHYLSDFYAGYFAYTTAWYYGFLNQKKQYRGPTNKYVGIQVGNYGNSVLMYFNPERV